MIDIFILKMTDTMNDRYLYPQKWNYFFFSKLLQHHSSILTNNWYSEWYISIIFIPAIFKHFSSSILVSFKYHSSLHYYSILLTILPNCAGLILPPAPFQQCTRLNFCKEYVQPGSEDIHCIDGRGQVTPSSRSFCLIRGTCASRFRR